VLIDIYALSPERSATVVERFLARFMPHRVRADADYTVRVGGDEPAAVFDTPEELAAFCEAEPRADARAYWTSRVGGEPHSAHVFFLPDGGLVLGLSVAAQEQAAWDRWLAELRWFAGAAHGYWIGECPPEDTVAEFVAVAQRHAEPGAAADGGA
jgi:phage terminase large subunit-like protein